MIVKHDLYQGRVITRRIHYKNNRINYYVKNLEERSSTYA